VAGVVVLGWLLALSGYDVRQRRLPNWLTLPGAGAVVLVAAAVGHFGAAAAGGLALFGLYALIHLAAPAAMGAGDVKLAIGLGALTGVFGLDVWTLAAVAAPLLTAVWAVVAFAVVGARTVPHGPAMCAASAGAVLLAVM
jgi:leader peptidase (prepilin peptidase) / N-methyltransferase